MKTFIKPTILTALLLMFPLVTQAETVVRTGESVSVASGQVVEQDFYAYAGAVTQSGEIVGDMYAVSGSVTVNGPIGADLTVVGGSVQIHSTIGDDLRVISGETVLAGEVGGDVFVMGGLLKVLSSATVNGNIYFYGGELDTEGTVVGSLLGYADKFVVNGAIGGGIDVTGDVTLGDKAEVQGGVQYKSARELDRAQNSTIEGSINHLPIDTSESPNNNWWLVPSIVWAFTTLGCYLFLRNSLEGFVGKLKNNATKSGLVGLGAFILLPVLAFILMATVLGIWFGILVLLSWMLLFIVSMLLLPIFVGYYLFVLFKRKRRLDVLTVLSGIVVTTLLAIIPVIGGLFLLMGVVTVAGHLSLSLYRVIKEIL